MSGDAWNFSGKPYFPEDAPGWEKLCTPAELKEFREQERRAKKKRLQSHKRRLENNGQFRVWMDPSGLRLARRMLRAREAAHSLLQDVSTDFNAYQTEVYEHPFRTFFKTMRHRMRAWRWLRAKKTTPLPPPKPLDEEHFR